MSRLLVVSGLVFTVVFAGVAVAESARAPALLTYAALGERQGLCVSMPDGSRARLTRALDSSPSWSPDGRYVAFSRQELDGPSRIVVANSFGRVVRRFGSGTANEDPAWSPDGSRIAYVGGSRLVVATASGRTLVTIPSGNAQASSPAWSADGRRIAYSEHLDSDAFEREGQPSSVVAVDADGTGRRVLARSAGEPSWSPDGARLAYVSYRSRWSETGRLLISDADGGNARRLTTAAEPESQPSWSPDGRRIAFVRGPEGQTSVVVVRSDGRDPRVIARSAADPAWRPPVTLPKGSRPPC